MAFEVMHADGGYAQRVSQARADAGADQQRAGQTGPGGVGDGVEVGQRCAGLAQDFPGQRQNPADVVAGRQFRHHPAVIGVQGHLGVQCVGKQAAPGVVEGDAGFVAGGFDA